MTSDDARDLFTDAFDGLLDAEQQAAFDAAVAADEDLAIEWAEFRELLAGTAALAEADEAVSADVDVLSGVQRKLRARSGGRFYRDRYSADLARHGTVWPLVLALLMLLVLGAAYGGLHFTQELGDPPPTSTDADDTAS